MALFIGNVYRTCLPDLSICQTLYLDPLLDPFVFRPYRIV